MSSKTKIIVIPKIVLIAAVIILLLIISIAVFMGFQGNKTQEMDTQKAQSTASDHIYTPGVYTSSIMLDGNQLDIKVTLDANNINDIEMLNLSEAVTTMYPMLSDNFNELAKNVCENGSTDNIRYSSDVKYTTSVLLNGINSCLEKAQIHTETKK